MKEIGRKGRKEEEGLSRKVNTNLQLTVAKFSFPFMAYHILRVSRWVKTRLSHNNPKVETLVLEWRVVNLMDIEENSLAFEFVL